MTVSAKPEQQHDWLQRNLFWVIRTSWLTYILLALSLLTVVFTYLVLTGSTPIEPTQDVRLYLTVLLAFLLLALAALVIGRLVQLWQARRAGSAGARLHGRLVTIFSLIAVVPVVMTAGAAAITINLAMEAWFSGGVRSVVDNSLAVTNAYFEEHTGKLRNDSLIVASTIDTISPLQIINPLEFGRILENIANKLSADILAVEISREPTDDAVTELGSAKTRFTELTPPTESEMSVARSGEPALSIDYDDGQIRSVAKLVTTIKKDSDIFIVLVRNLNPQILEYQRNTQQVV